MHSVSTKKMLVYQSRFPDITNIFRTGFCGPSNCGNTKAVALPIFTYNQSLSISLNINSYKLDLANVLDGVNHVPLWGNEEVVSVNNAKRGCIHIRWLACEKNNIKAYFCMGSHNNVDGFYLCQSYARIPKHLVHHNMHFLLKSTWV